MTRPQLRPVRLWQAEVASETRADGSILVWQRGELPTYPDRLSDRIAHWAKATPDAIWMAERGPDGGWQTLSYAEMFDQIRSIGQALLNLGLSAKRPLVILSGNSIAHGLMALGAQYVGIPSAAIAPAYATTTNGFDKLQQIKSQIHPAALFAENPDQLEPAIAEVFPGLPRLGKQGKGLALAWEDMLATKIKPETAQANATTGPDTIAKFLFTSGTTGTPKAVIQTQRMLCSSMEMVLDLYAYFREQPPVFLDWAPWNHVASGNKVFNMALYNGGAYYIDGGKPVRGLFETTCRNIREVSPTWYFNVPAGFELLVDAMNADPDLAKCFFKDLKLLMYAGAAMAEHTWSELDRLAAEATGERVLLSTGLGATETAPDVLFCTEPQDVPGNIGIPMKGVTLKLVPVDDRWEAHVKGPCVTPGYWGNPALTAEVFDDEGYYNLGDALRFAEPGNPAAGFFFDGRTAENFKLATGTWVAVGPLRAKITDALGGLVRDAVIADEGRGELGALLIPFRPALERLVAEGHALSDAELCDRPEVHQEVRARLLAYNQSAGGSSLRVPRVMFLSGTLDLNKGEITDKGSVNQRAILRSRKDQVEALFAGAPGVIHCAPEAK